MSRGGTPPQTEAAKANRFKSAQDTADFHEFVERLANTGRTIKDQRSELAELKLELKKRDGQLAVMRAERDRYKREFEFYAQGVEDPIALPSDENWLFYRDVSIKFRQKPDGKRIVVLRARGKKVERLRARVTPSSPVTELLRAVFEVGREQNDPRALKRKVKNGRSPGKNPQQQAKEPEGVRQDVEARGSEGPAGADLSDGGPDS